MEEFIMEELIKVYRVRTKYFLGQKPAYVMFKYRVSS